MMFINNHVTLKFDGKDNAFILESKDFFMNPIRIPGSYIS